MLEHYRSGAELESALRTRSSIGWKRIGLRMSPSVLSCVMNAGPYGRELVCAQTKPTLSPSAVLLPVLCQSYCPNSVQHAFLGIDMSGPCLSLPLFPPCFSVSPILVYNTSGLIFVPIPSLAPFLSLFLGHSVCTLSIKRAWDEWKQEGERSLSGEWYHPSQGLYHMLTFSTGTLLPCILANY